MSTGEPHYTGHRSRLRSRFRDAGRGALSDYEILELLLGYAIPRKDTKPLAKELLEEYGSLRRIFDESLEALERRKGIGEYSRHIDQARQGVCDPISGALYRGRRHPGQPGSGYPLSQAEIGGERRSISCSCA